MTQPQVTVPPFFKGEARLVQEGFLASGSIYSRFLPGALARQWFPALPQVFRPMRRYSHWFLRSLYSAGVLPFSSPVTATGLPPIFTGFPTLSNSFLKYITPRPLRQGFSAFAFILHPDSQDAQGGRGQARQAAGLAQGGRAVGGQNFFHFSGEAV